jgi:hypothetical protein
MDSTCARVGRVAGRTVLFVGQEVQTQGWAPQDLAAAARTARALGIDSLCVKRGEGTVRWYGAPEQLQEEYRAVTSAGCGYIPLWYCDGPRFGLDFVERECDELKVIMQAIAAVDPERHGFICADLEVEWNYQAAAAQRFAAAMHDAPGDLFLTTWADPIQQGWGEVTRALAPVVRAWIPQQYSDWLAAQEGQLVALGESCLQPAIDLSGEFGGNHPIAIAQAAAARGQTTVWIWEWQFAAGPFRQETQAIVATMRRAGGLPSPVPPPASNPSPGQTLYSYTIQPGQTLTSIAAGIQRRYRYAGSERDLFLANRAHLDQTARRYGHADSQNGNLIFAGDTLHFAAPKGGPFST